MASGMALVFSETLSTREANFDQNTYIGFMFYAKSGIFSLPEHKFYGVQTRCREVTL
jgi:hypothetical protein